MNKRYTTEKRYTSENCSVCKKWSSFRFECALCNAMLCHVCYSRTAHQDHFEKLEVLAFIEGRVSLGVLIEIVKNNMGQSSRDFKKINAIKDVRKRFGSSLRDAKEMVELAYNQMLYEKEGAPAIFCNLCAKQIEGGKYFTADMRFGIASLLVCEKCFFGEEIANEVF